MAKKKARRKKATKKARRKASAGTKPRALTGASTVELRAELARRSRELKRLETRRAKLITQLEEVETEIASYGGPAAGGLTASGRPRKRPKNTMTLEEALARVLKGRTMSVTEVSEAVQEAGYRTSSSTFRTIVNQTLIKSKKFKKVGHGKYTAR